MSPEKERVMRLIEVLLTHKSILYVLCALLLIFIILLIVRVKGGGRTAMDPSSNNKNSKGQLSAKTRGNEEGIIFGITKMGKLLFSKTDEEGHVAIFGGSGVGKTSALLIPTLRKWKGTFLAIDISGDIRKNVKKDNCISYDPLDPNGVPFNVFAAIDEIESVEEQNEALSQMALLIMPDSFKASEAQKFFVNNGRKMLTAALIAMYHQGMDFIEICENFVGSSYMDLFDIILNSTNESAIRMINSFKGTNEKNTAGCKQAADEKLDLFANNDIIKGSIRRPMKGEECFSPITLEEKSVFVVIPDEKLKLYSSLLGLITAMSLEFLSQRENYKKPKILLCLDEFASLGHLNILDALRKLRKKNVRIMMLTQSVPDLDLEYGADERKSMMNNYKYKVVLEASDPDTQKYFAELIGQVKEKKINYTTGTHNTSKTESQERTWAVEPSMLANLGDKLILIHNAGWIELKKNFYFKYDK